MSYVAQYNHAMWFKKLTYGLKATIFKIAETKP